MKKPKAPKAKVKVLYQYLGGKWYAFAESGEEVFFGQVPLKQGVVSATSKKGKGKNTTKDA